MQRYYIHVIDGDATYRDLEGSEASDLRNAEELAQSAARELVAEALKSGNASAPLECWWKTSRSESCSKSAFPVRYQQAGWSDEPRPA